jgi:hypothetical protein
MKDIKYQHAIIMLKKASCRRIGVRNGRGKEEAERRLKHQQVFRQEPCGEPQKKS